MLRKKIWVKCCIKPYSSKHRRIQTYYRRDSIKIDRTRRYSNSILLFSFNHLFYKELSATGVFSYNNYHSNTLKASCVTKNTASNIFGNHHQALILVMTTVLQFRPFIKQVMSRNYSQKVESRTITTWNTNSIRKEWCRKIPNGGRGTSSVDDDDGETLFYYCVRCFTGYSLGTKRMTWNFKILMCLLLKKWFSRRVFMGYI